MRSVECSRVWGEECKVWSVKCRVWSLKCKLWSVECGVRSFPHRHGDATGKPETRDETRRCRKTSISYETTSNFDIFDTLSNRLECHKVPRLPRKKDMTSCLETFVRKNFCGFPHRHREATGKPETRDETRGCRKTSMSYETSSNIDSFDTLSNRLECHKAPRLPRKKDMTGCLETFEKKKFCSFPHRHREATGKPETGDETRGCRKTSMSYETSSNIDSFDTLSNRLECHKAPRLPRKKDMTGCLETFEKKKFCSFPHRHREATGKPETRDETRGCRKANISYETSSNFSQFVASKSTFSSGFL